MAAQTTRETGSDVRNVMEHTEKWSGLLQHLWGTAVPGPQRSIACQIYFAYYTTQARIAINNPDQAKRCSLRTHEDVVAIAKQIRNLDNREAIKDSLIINSNTKPEDTTPFDAAIDLTARFLSMMEVGSLSTSFSGHTNLNWSSGTLQKCVEEHFCASTPVLTDTVKFEKLFTARNLTRIIGLKINWTDNLAEHLRLIDDDRVLSIFHHATFLLKHQT
jgi:hypothetical protein